MSEERLQNLGESNTQYEAETNQFEGNNTIDVEDLNRHIIQAMTQAQGGPSQTKHQDALPNEGRGHLPPINQRRQPQGATNLFFGSENATGS